MLGEYVVHPDKNAICESEMLLGCKDIYLLPLPLQTIHITELGQLSVRARFTLFWILFCFSGSSVCIPLRF